MIAYLLHTLHGEDFDRFVQTWCHSMQSSIQSTFIPSTSIQSTSYLLNILIEFLTLLPEQGKIMFESIK